ncbi:MAG: hypothetical protein M9907_04535 [Burkholderiaceae bacterium]|nr:hypothetical protein [Rhodocyclaceae bacterium]MCO5106334.1 hypothetical protein [Burkholderiaceae bacterium]
MTPAIIRLCGNTIIVLYPDGTAVRISPSGQVRAEPLKHAARDDRRTLAHDAAQNKNVARQTGG